LIGRDAFINKANGHSHERTCRRQSSASRMQGKERPMIELTQLYDDSQWTDGEMDLLAWEAGKHAGWEEMDEYDPCPEKT
jgi:hypothetical protein